MSRRGWLLFATMGVLWGMPYLLIRIAVRGIEPPALVFLRTAPSGLMLLPLLLRRDVLRSLRRRWKLVLVYTVVEVTLPWLLLFRAEQRLSSSLSGLLVATVPLISVLLSRVSNHEGPLGTQRFAGLALGLCGVAVLVGIDVRGPDLISVAEIAGVAVGYAAGPFLVSRYLSDVPAIGVVAASLIVTAIVYAPFGLTHLPQRVTPEELTSLVLLIVFCTGLAFMIFFQLIAEVGPARATVITYVNPAVAIVLGIIILGEHFSLGIAVGFPLVLAGCFLGTGGLKRADPRVELAALRSEIPVEPSQIVD